MRVLPEGNAAGRVRDAAHLLADERRITIVSLVNAGARAMKPAPEAAARGRRDALP